MVSIIIKDGVKYVKDGKSRIRVSSKLSERDLLKWIIKHFSRRRKKNPRKKNKEDKSPPKKDMNFTTTGTISIKS